MKKIIIIFSIICLLLILCGIYFYFENTTYILGINDPSFNKERDILDSEIVKNNMENIQYNKDNFTILLSHRPELVIVELINWG